MYLVFTSEKKVVYDLFIDFERMPLCSLEIMKEEGRSRQSRPPGSWSRHNVKAPADYTNMVSRLLIAGTII